MDLIEFALDLYSTIGHGYIFSGLNTVNTVYRNTAHLNIATTQLIRIYKRVLHMEYSR